MTILMSHPSHRISENGKTVTIHDLEVFCAYDPAIDGESDPELKKFDNERVLDIVNATAKYMTRGSYPRLVVMHEKDGNEPKSAVGRFTRLGYQERDGVGYIVGDCEVERSVFDKLLATNAFPRRSAEIWADQNHLSEVALLGRETPRRPLPDTHFTRKGDLVTFARAIRFDMGTVGGGQSTYVPNTKETNMADYDKEIAALKCDMDEMKSMMKKHFGEGEDEKKEKKEKKDEMSADDMLSEQFAEEQGEGDGVHIDIDSHSEEEEEEEAKEMMFPASRPGRADVFAMRRENAKMQREIKTLRAEISREKFGRELDAMEADGYRIPASHRPRLIAELSASSDASALLESWRELFNRDPMGVRIDMGRSALPSGDLDTRQVADLVREFAGKPAEFTKAINSRLKGR
jgi:hypothetical protein